MADGFIESKAFQCHSCNSVLLSKYGATKHYYLAFINQQLCRKANQRRKMIIEYILRYIATSNIPFRAVTNDFLKQSFQLNDPCFELPGIDKLIEEMNDLSNQINNRTFQNIFGEKVSLLVDGCKRWGQHYQGAIIFSSERLYLYKIASVNDSSAKSITKFISDIIIDLSSNYNTTVISVSTDNFISNKKAMNNTF